MGKMIVYQILPRLWGKGKFSDIDGNSLSYFKDLGVTHVWFTGLLRHATVQSYEGCPKSSQAIVKGDAGSPYAIVDYYDVNPYLADRVEDRMLEFESLLKRTHASYLKVIMDFVPNHVSRDYGKVGLVNKEVQALGAGDDCSVHWKPENDFFYYPGQVLDLPSNKGAERPYYENPAKASGNAYSPSPGINDWYDTIRLNYCDFHTGTWDKMYDIVRYWCRKGVDGFRCDMVEMVPKEFFSWLIPLIKKEFPGVIFIAEVYSKDLYFEYAESVGFDYLYDKSGLYDTLRAVAAGQGSVRGITWNWQGIDRIQPRMLNFLENHDEQRFASRFFGGEASRSFPYLAASLYLNTAPFMLYFGEEVGEKGLSDGRTSIFNWGVDPALGRLCEYARTGKGLLEDESRLFLRYRDALRFASNPSIGNGLTYDLCYCNQGSEGFDPDRHFAFLRSDGQNTFLVACNFSSVPARTVLNVPQEAYSYLGTSGSSSVKVEVPAWDFVVVQVSGK